MFKTIININELDPEKFAKIINGRVICPCCGEDLGLYLSESYYFCNKCGEKQTNNSLKITFYKNTTLPFELSIEDIS